MRICTLLLVLLINSFVFAADFGGGTGTPEDPYLIYNYSQLEVLNQNDMPDLFTKHYKMMADITMPEQPFEQVFVGAGQKFTGTFDGNGHKIIGFKFLRGEDRSLGRAGFFDMLYGDAVVKNLTLKNCQITNESNAGGIVYYMWDNSQLVNCHVTGSVISNEYDAGGLAYWLSDNSKIVLSSFTGAVAGNEAGGICMGLFCGSSQKTLIKDSKVDAQIQGESCGGICASSSGDVINCYVRGSIKSTGANGDAGGVVGVVSSQSIIKNCYSLADVNAVNDAGGLVSSNSGLVVNCFAAGAVAGEDATGLIESITGKCYRSFWDVEKTGQTLSICGTGVTSEQLMDRATFPGWGDGSWKINDGVDYPHLSWEDCEGTVILEPERTYSGGQGTQQLPYQLSCAQDILTLSVFFEDWDQHFVMTNDIDLAGYNFTTALIGANCNYGYSYDKSFRGIAFDGVFDGAGHKLLNLQISGVDITGDGVFDNAYLGLFGKIGQGSVFDLGLANCDIQGGRYVGCMAGYASGVSNCYAKGRVIGEQYVGGLAGSITGEVRDCYTDTEVIGGDMAGGFAGYNWGNIINCHSIGNILCRETAGGFCSQNTGPMVNCFWNADRTNITVSYGGESLSEEQMKSKDSFAGWGDGSWKINDECDFPRLVWEPRDGELIVDQPRAYSGGNGTDDDPYHISTIQDLMALSQYPSDTSKSFVLMDNIELSALEAAQAVIPLFTGTFDGNGYTVSCLGIADKQAQTSGDLSDSYIGFFGQLENASISNMRLIDFDLSGSSYVGGLAAEAVDSQIDNVDFVGRLNGTQYIGGMVGSVLNCKIRNCSSNCYIHGGSNAGGLVGKGVPSAYDLRNDNVISACRSKTEIIIENMEDYFSRGLSGGLAGSWVGEINDSCAIVDIDAQSVVLVGGLCGTSGANMRRCFASGTVRGGGSVGGLAGEQSFMDVISDCYSNVDVSGSSSVGGLVGYQYVNYLSNDKGIINCYSSGKVLGQSDVGGVLGYSGNPFSKNPTGNVYGSYFLQGSGPDNGYGQALSLEQMKTGASFAGWDFDAQEVDGTPAIWKMIREGEDFPRLEWQPIYNGDIAGLYGVDLIDAAEFAAHWNDSDCEQNNNCQGADINKDGSVGLGDLAMFVQDWLEGI